MSFNIRYENHYDVQDSWNDRKEDIVKLINANEPDILGVQEALPGPFRFLRSKLDSYKCIGVGREDGIDQGERAVIFFKKDKYEILDSDNIWLSETRSIPSVGWDACTYRIATYVRLMDKRAGTIIHVFNTHFDHEGEIARIESAKLIVNYIKEKKIENEQIVFMGDFNSYPESETIGKLLTFFDDSSQVCEQRTDLASMTYNDFSEDPENHTRIDYIFTRNIRVQSYRVISMRRENNRFISDHYPIIIEISQ